VKNVVLRSKDLIILKSIVSFGFRDAYFDPQITTEEFKDFCYRTGLEKNFEKLKLKNKLA
jgi:hypothetical protein